MSKSIFINLNFLLACLFMLTISSETIPQRNIRIDSNFHSNHDTPRKLVNTVQSIVSTNASLPKGFKCTNITYLGLVKPFEVCFTSTSLWESNENKTQHFHLNNFTVYDSKNQSKPLFKIGISKKSDATTAAMVLSSAEWVQVFDIGQCQQKRYCGDDKYSADCTNIVFGRKVKCEPLFPLFFPFTEEAITSSMPLAILNSTKASAKPLFRPTQSPTLKIDVTLAPKVSSRPVLMSVPKKVAGDIITPSPSAVPMSGVPVFAKSFSPTASPKTTGTSKLPSKQPMLTRGTTAPTRKKVAGDIITPSPSAVPISGVPVFAKSFSPTASPKTTGTSKLPSKQPMLTRGTTAPTRKKVAGDIITPSPSAVPMSGVPVFVKSFSPTASPKTTGTSNQPILTRGTNAPTRDNVAGNIITPSPSIVPRSGVPVFANSFSPTVPTRTGPIKLPSNQPLLTRGTTAPTKTKSTVAPITYPTSAPQRQSSDSINTSGPSYPQPSVRCINYTYPGMIGNPFKICYSDQVSYIDGVVSTLRNGTKAAVPCLKHTYNIYNGGNMTAPAFTIILKRTGNHVTNDVDTSKFHVAKVAGVARCRWAHYCGNKTFTADCTNMRYGRRAICEPITPLFFPFTGDAVRSTDRNPIVKLTKPTRAPVPKPTRAPVPAPTVSYTTITNGTVLQCRNVTYNATSIPFKVCYKTKQVIQRSVKYLWNGIKPYVIEWYDYNQTLYNQNRTKAIGIIGFGKSTNVYPNGTSSIRSVYVKVVGIAKCKSYSYCGQDNKFSADCTNLLYGRNVTCESIDPVFYPFTNEAIIKGSTIKRILP